MSLSKANVIGEKYIHVFNMDDGSLKDVETTQADYEQLAQFNHRNPTIKDGVWSHSTSAHKLDTPSGNLENGVYFEENGTFIGKVNGVVVFASSLEELETIYGTGN